MVSPPAGSEVVVRKVEMSPGKVEWRKRVLSLVTLEDEEPKKEMLLTYHHVFSVEGDEHGETVLVQLCINTGTLPQRSSLQEGYCLLKGKNLPSCYVKKMQKAQIIQPSSSPWTTPVVLVRKKDGSLHFCADYCELNKV